MAYTKTVFFAVFITGCLCFPVDDPIRIDLPVYDQPQLQAADDMPSVSSDHWPLAYDSVSAKSVFPEIYPGGRVEPSFGGTFNTHKLNVLGNALESKASYIGGPFADPVTKLESAARETEGLGSKALSIKENIFQNIVAGLLQPKPIVDTISEADKYGNTGDKFYSTGKAVVGGASQVANLVNSVLEVPGKIFGMITRAATEKLNNLGGKLVGL